LAISSKEKVMENNLSWQSSKKKCVLEPFYVNDFEARKPIQLTIDFGKLLGLKNQLKLQNDITKKI
jgi:hypothetical protein